MKQPTKKKTIPTKRTAKKTNTPNTKKTNGKRAVRKHPQYGTSKLEEDFAREFLDKLGVKYKYQFEAKDIGRFYDFCIFINGVENDLSIGNILLLEVDGGYFHSDPRVVNEDKLSPMQKKNKRVDEYKNKWALEHGIPLIRVWEKDIRENPNEVLRQLKERLYIEDKKQTLIERKNKRHVNKIK